MVTAKDTGRGKAHLAGILLVTVATIVWATAGLFTRLLPYDLWTIVFWRGVFASVFIGLVVLLSLGRSALATVRRAGLDGVLVTICSAATIILFPAAFQNTTIANAFTIIAALPFVTAAIAWVWLGERPSLATMLASAVALLGIAIMLGPTTSGPRLGDGLAALATLSQALMTVVIRRNPEIRMLPMAWAAVALSVLVSWPLAQHLGDFAGRDYLVAAGFGLGPVTLGMMLYVLGSAMIPATLSALINTMEAPLGALWAWVGVGEVPAFETFLGGGIVLSGVVGRLLSDRHQRRTPD